MDTVSKEKRSEIMSRIRSKHTGPEKALKEALLIPWTRGTKAEFNADFLFPYAKVAVFVDGEFWHGKGKVSTLRKWREKIEGNVRRDRRNRGELRRRGWLVLEIWAARVLRDPGGTASFIEYFVVQRAGAADEQGELFNPMAGVSLG